jgi:ABC-type branched-subunit amino acid transport system ATPase component
VTLIGSNGAGKSTLMMTICGTPRARHGSIVFDGTDITNMPTHMIARLGISQSPEGRRIFPRMTVLENLQMGAHWSTRSTSTRIWRAPTRCSRSSRSASRSAAERFRAASSRCWRSPAP